MDQVQELDAFGRQQDLLAEDARHRAEIERARLNKDFTQVYPAGWRRIRELADLSPAAVKLYALLAEHVDERAGAIVASQVLLADLLGISERTVRRLTASLEQIGALVRVKITTGTYAYAVNPREVWKSWDNTKKGAAFITKTLVDQKSATKGAIKLKQMIDGNIGQMDLED